MGNEERDRWIRLFNRLERHVSRHFETKGGTGFCDDADDVLHRGWRQVMRDAAGQNDATPDVSGATLSRSTELGP